MTLAISMLNNIFPCMLKTKNVISSIPMWYAKYHIVNILCFKKLLILTNSIIMTISTCDTLRPLGISTLGPLQIVCMTLNTIKGVVV